ncbi:Dolichol kinase [Operophtera brumata]|uniref:dolichol kinase n=1 Tax=Operophtera brumata TaxID=104452 RepID=A0A0L7KXR4_OPEBR|nr:Dolichol kinase [Operophtera brumata]
MEMEMMTLTSKPWCDVSKIPAKSNGLWCCVLLPAVLMVNKMLYNVSPIYSLVAYVSLGLLFYCLLFIIFMSVSCLVLNESVYGGYLLFSLLCSTPTIFSFIGEAMIVAQSIMLYGVMTVAKLFWDAVLSTVGLIVTAICLMKDESRGLENLVYITAGAATFALIMLHLVLGVDCLPKIITFFLFHQTRARLVTFWLTLVLFSVFVITMRTKLAVKADTVTRKSFHVLASVVFLSGVIGDQDLMMLAAGVGLGLLLLVELAVKDNTVTRKSFHVLASVVFLSGVIGDQDLMMLAAGVGLGLLLLVED